MYTQPVLCLLAAMATVPSSWPSPCAIAYNQTIVPAGRSLRPCRGKQASTPLPGIRRPSPRVTLGEFPPSICLSLPSYKWLVCQHATGLHSGATHPVEPDIRGTAPASSPGSEQSSAELLPRVNVKPSGPGEWLDRRAKNGCPHPMQTLASADPLLSSSTGMAHKLLAATMTRRRQHGGAEGTREA